MLTPDNNLPIKFNPRASEGGYEKSSRPLGAPKSDKNFNKLVNNVNRNLPEEDEEPEQKIVDPVAASEETDRDSSLFDLSNQKKSVNKQSRRLSNPATVASHAEEPADKSSLFDLSAQKNKKVDKPFTPIHTPAADALANRGQEIRDVAQNLGNIDKEAAKPGHVLSAFAGSTVNKNLKEISDTPLESPHQKTSNLDSPLVAFAHSSRSQKENAIKPNMAENLTETEPPFPSTDELKIGKKKWIVPPHDPSSTVAVQDTKEPQQNLASIHDFNETDQPAEISSDVVASLNEAESKKIARSIKDIPHQPSTPLATLAPNDEAIPDELKVSSKGLNKAILSPEFEREAVRAKGSRSDANLIALDTDATVPAEKTTVKGKPHAPFDPSQERTDLAYLNPGLPVVNIQDSNQTSGGTIASPALIREVVNQIVQTAYTLKQEGRTDTVITLKHPPILENANITITAFDTAKGEFNIAFSNLTGPAKELLDQRLNQDSLQEALKDKGFIVHILTTTTLAEGPAITSDAAQDRHYAREEEENRGGQFDSYPEDDQT
jgi:hypothetical protein